MFFLSKKSLIGFTILLIFLNGCDTQHSSDGEGAAVIDIDHVIAGSLSRFKVVYTVGDSGIKVGGGVSVGLHHASDWKMQVFSRKQKISYLPFICERVFMSILLLLPALLVGRKILRKASSFCEKAPRLLTRIKTIIYKLFVHYFIWRQLRIENLFPSRP